LFIMNRTVRCLLVFLLPLAGCVEPPADKEKPKALTKLEVTVTREGDGPAVKQGDRILVHYTGRLRSNGKKFDSSHDSGKPFPFVLGVGKVIQGWDEGLIGMKVGSTCTLEIPAKMAYGSRGAGSDIPPNADLVFEVELLEVLK
jgi:FKBP-type peptidyl-prolyl cis-trans isomerase FkpA